jgi:arylsulfatase A-like enzyme
MPNTHHFLISTFFSLVVSATYTGFANDTLRSGKPPNIVVLLSDDCGFNEFSMQGSTLFHTPRIDSIARAGIRFSNGYVSGVVCSPSRAGILTGRYQQRFGHEFNIPAKYSEVNGLSLSEKTIGDAMRQGGYRTIALGKWHLGYAPKFYPVARGFDSYYGFLQGQRSYFPLENPGRLNQMLRDGEPVRPEKFGYLTDELARAAAEYIVDNKERPFFMYVAFNATHTPLHALKSDLAAVEAETAGQQEPANRLKLRAMARGLDRGVGVILDELKKQSLLENTLVIFLNDNGGAVGHDNAPLRGHKGQTWEGGMRVPFAMQWPGVLPQGKVDDRPVIALDIFPTAMALAGIEKSPGKSLDGVNLIPFLTGKTSERPHKTLFWKSGKAWAVRDGDLKLVVGEQNVTEPELFDLAADMRETTNLANQRPQDVTRLKKLYEEWKIGFAKPIWGPVSEDEP